jgi:tetratricopeptide (TPR) repeat protein
VAENYERAMALCDELGPCPEAPYAVYGLATVTELRGEYERTDRLLQPLVDMASDVAGEAEELLACSMFHQGRFDESLEHAVAVLDAWDGSSESVLLSRLAEHPASSCSSWAALSCWYLGRYEDSLRFADEAIAIGHRHTYGLSTAQAQRAFLHQLRGEPERCREWALATIELADEQGFPMRALQGQILLGWAEAIMGEAGDGTGVARAEAAFARFRATGARLTEPYFLALLADAHLAGDRAELAVRLLEEALGSIGRGSRTFFAAPEVHRLMARALLACGRPPDDAEVRSHLTAAVSAARELRSPTLELRALVETAGVVGDRGDGTIERIGRLLDELRLAEDLPDVVAAHEVLVAHR